MTVIMVLIFLIISLAIVWFLVALDRGPKEPIGALWIAFGFGLLALIISGVVENLLLDDSWLPNSNYLIAFAAAMAVGAIEEFAKFIPLSIFIFKKKYFNEYNDGVIYFAICGLSFGFVENLFYTLFFGAEVGFARLILLPIFHGATTAMVGYFLSSKKINGKSWTGTILMLLAAMLIHGLYNFGISSEIFEFIVIAVMLVVFLTTMLFVLYANANSKDKLAGISGSGFNKYCSGCGRKNTNSSLFCEYCGKKYIKL